LQPHLAPGVEVGRDRGEGDGQILDNYAAHQLADTRCDALCADDAGGGEGHVEQAQDIHPAQREYPIGEVVQLARYMQATDQGTH